MPRGTKYSELFNEESKSTNIISNTDLIKEEIALLLKMQKYSLFFGNNMGLGSKRYLHLGNNLATFNLIKADIENLFRKYKRAILVKTEMQFNKTTSTLVINLTLSTNKSRQNLFNVAFEISE